MAMGIWNRYNRCKSIYPVGEDGCDIGLQDNGRLLFLVVAQRDPNTGDFPVHECDIKEGISILFPILNVACNNFAMKSHLSLVQMNKTRESMRIKLLKMQHCLTPCMLSVRLELKSKIRRKAGHRDIVDMDNRPFLLKRGLIDLLDRIYGKHEVHLIIKYRPGLTKAVQPPGGRRCPVSASNRAIFRLHGI